MSYNQAITTCFLDKGVTLNYLKHYKLAKHSKPVLISPQSVVLNASHRRPQQNLRRRAGILFLPLGGLHVVGNSCDNAFNFVVAVFKRKPVKNIGAKFSKQLAYKRMDK